MKIYCERCEKCFDDKDIIIDGRVWNNHAFHPYCKKCHKVHCKENDYEE